jgi:hypothetical protein
VKVVDRRMTRGRAILAAMGVSPSGRSMVAAIGILPLCGCTVLFDGGLPSDPDVVPVLTPDAGLDASIAVDGPSEAEEPKCGSRILAPTMAVASTEIAPNVASSAIDGLLMTRWESVDAVDPQWLDVDFGVPVFIDEVDILWEAACAKDYDLEVSMDEATWTSVPNGSVTENTLAANPPGDPPVPPTDWSAAVVTKPLAAVGRYLRITGTMRCTIYGYSIWEMRAYGDRNASCSP